MYGRMMNTKLGYVHFWITLVCGYGVFLPMHFVGIAGAPRRYYDSTSIDFIDKVMDLQPLISVFAIVGAIGQIFFLFNFFHSIFRGQKAIQNPWKGNTLEWTTPVEHMHGNWPGSLPEVHRWAYDYSNPAHEADFVPQTTPPLEGEVMH
jgi:cytochrome c oxidase subunit 1